MILRSLEDNLNFKKNMRTNSQIGAMVLPHVCLCFVHAIMSEGYRKNIGVV